LDDKKNVLTRILGLQCQFGIANLNFAPLPGSPKRQEKSSEYSTLIAPSKRRSKKMVSHFSDEKISAVQGQTTSLNEKKNILTRVAAMEECSWYQALLGGRETLNLFVPLNGSCQFIRRNLLKELSGWDENSLTEDVELALRLVQNKHQIKYAEDICRGQENA
jgi:hypothetical protein